MKNIKLKFLLIFGLLVSLNGYAHTNDTIYLWKGQVPGEQNIITDIKNDINEP